MEIMAATVRGKKVSRAVLNSKMSRSKLFTGLECRNGGSILILI